MGRIDWWHALEGAAKYAAILADPAKRAGREEIRNRASKCRICPSNTLATQRDTGQRLCFCGPPLQETPGPKPTCGCLIFAKPPAGIGANLTIDGVPWRAVGKLEVASEECPQGKW